MRLSVVAGWWALLACFWASELVAQESRAAEPADPDLVVESEIDPELAHLGPRHRQFLEEAELLLSEGERSTFLSLEKAYQRDAFVRRFWAVRDPYPQTGRNEFEERWRDRLEMAREEYGGSEDPRGRMLLLNGPPTRQARLICGDLVRPLLVWSYERTDRIQAPFSLVFVSRTGAVRGDYELWYPSRGMTSLLRLGVQEFDPGSVQRRISEECARAGEILDAIANAIDWGRVEGEIDLVPRPGEEWLQTFVSFSTDLPAEASTFEADLELTFPGRYQSRTVVQGLLTVPLNPEMPRPAEAGESGEPPSQGAADLRGYVLDGEVLRQGELFEHFRYRYPLSVPEAEAGGTEDGELKLPLLFQRYLRPGEYTLILKVEDVSAGMFYREERPLTVPSAAAIAAGEFATESSIELSEANETLVDGDYSVKLFAPPPRLLTGKTRFDALTTGDGIARVRFLLDGKPVLSKTRPPFSAELDLGSSPRVHVVEAVAQNKAGETLASDEIVLNAGPHRFSARLIEPRNGKTYRQSLRAQAVIDIPEGERLDRVEFYLNDERLTSLYQGPYVQPVTLPENSGVSYVRVVAYLEDGNSAEDIVIVNAPDFTDKTRVQLVELYSTILDRRLKPVEGVSKDEVTVVEDGVEQAVQRFELVRDQPIYAGVLIDTSASMAEELRDAIDGALRFFQTVLTPKDRAAVMTFSEQPHLAVRFTNDPEVLAGGLTDLTAFGETALYDSLVEALYYFSGIQRKRAIILLSDGEDVGSRYNFEDVIEYARRTGVALYTIGLKLSSRQAEVRIKLQRLARETGGRSFFVDNSRQLGHVYDAIERELRTQYLIVYQSTNTSTEDRFRQVELQVTRPGLEAKTVSGYYP